MRIGAGFMRRCRLNVESLMRDTCEVSRKGRPVTNPDGTVSNDPVTVYQGKCKVQTAGGVGSESTQLGGLTQVWMLYVHFPYGTTGLKTGDIVEVRSANPTVDGHKYRLINPQSEQTWATAVRWNVKEVD